MQLGKDTDPSCATCCGEVSLCAANAALRRAQGQHDSVFTPCLETSRVCYICFKDALQTSAQFLGAVRR